MKIVIDYYIHMKSLWNYRKHLDFDNREEQVYNDKIGHSIRSGLCIEAKNQYEGS